MKEPEIVVLSGENRLDQYGNFFFKDKAGKEHKIGEKRKEKDQIAALVAMNTNKGVKLTYGEYKGFPFIEHIELVEEGLPEPVPVSSVPVPSVFEVPKIDTPPSKSREDGMREGMWWKVVSELIIAGKLSEVLGKENAISAMRAFRGQMVSVLDIPFDGAKFPKYE